jgi:hypothetical protein
MFDRFEATISLAYADLGRNQPPKTWVPLGTFMWRSAGIFGEMKQELKTAKESWPMIAAGFFDGSAERAREILEMAEAHLHAVREERGIF